MKIYKKNKSLDNRDIGKNNIVSKRGLSKSDIIDYDIYDVSKVMETLIKKLEHRYERAETFIEENKGFLEKSYYSIGYYNGLCRGYDEILDLLIDLFKNHKDRENTPINILDL